MVIPLCYVVRTEAWFLCFLFNFWSHTLCGSKLEFTTEGVFHRLFHPFLLQSVSGEYLIHRIFCECLKYNLDPGISVPPAPIMVFFVFVFVKNKPPKQQNSCILRIALLIMTNFRAVFIPITRLKSECYPKMPLWS